MARANDTLWYPKTYEVTSYAGTDMTSNFSAGITQLMAPVSMNITRSVPLTISMSDGRDPQQEARLVEAAIKKLASDINVSTLTAVSLKGSLALKKTTSASGFSDIADIEVLLNATGVPNTDRNILLSSADYNGLAKDLSVASRPLQGKSLSAYEKALVGQVAGFNTLKNDTAYRLTAAAGGAITVSTLDAAVNYWTPVATATVNGQLQNVDSRYQNILVSATANVKAGDVFTIAAVNDVHHVTKIDTGSLKTFRVVAVVDGTHLTITPPIISNQVASAAGAQYQNCVVNTKAANSAITWLNTTATNVSAFWVKDSVKLLAGRYNLSPSLGMSMMNATTESGIEIVITKQFDSNTGNTLIRADTLYGVDVMNNEFAGVALFGQA
jgi:P22 coat protein - gene protein 5